MTRPQTTHAARTFIAGVLAAHSLPHLGTAAGGGTLMTPLAGAESGPGVNAIWGAANLVAALAVTSGQPRPWRAGVVPFLGGVAAFSVWAFGFEAARARRARSVRPRRASALSAARTRR